MPLAPFEPGQEMALANFFLAIFCLFTIALPLLLITRGEKTEANRDFIAATINPWFQIDKEIKLTPVIITGMTPTMELQAKDEDNFEYNDKATSDSDSEVVISIDKKISDEQEKSSTQVQVTQSEVLAA